MINENDSQEYQRLDLSKLNFSDKVVTTEEAIQDVIPMNWSDDVLQGKKKVVMKNDTREI